MTRPLTDLARALSAETLRVRRTLALTVTLAAPAFVGAVVLLIGVRRRQPLPDDSGEAWSALFDSVWSLWTLLMLPLLITATTALLAQIEHGARTFKQLYATPTARWSVYTSKLLTACGLAALASVAAVGAIVLAGLALSAFDPEKNPLTLQLPLAKIAAMAGRPWLAALLLIALHTWIALRFRSFAVAVTVGILGTFSGAAFIGAEEGFYYPWLMPTYALPNVRLNQNGGPAIDPVWLGVAGGAVFGALGCWRVTRRDVDV